MDPKKICLNEPNATKFDIIAKLPVEISEMVFQNLSGFDIFQCSKVSSTWNMLSDSDLIWKKLCEKESLQKIDLETKPKRFKIFFNKYLSYWKGLYIYHLKIHCNWSHNDIRLKRLHDVKTINDVEIFYIDDEFMITYHSNYSIFVWSTEDQTFLHLLENERGVITAYSVYKDKITVSKLSRTIIVWNFVLGQELLRIESNYFVTSLRLINDELLCGCYDGKLFTLNMQFGHEQQQHFLAGHLQSVRCIDCDNEKLIASGSEDTSIILWDLDIKTRLFVLSEHTEMVSHLKFVGNYLVSSSSDEKICVWNKTTGKLIHTFLNNKLRIMHLGGNKILSYDTHLKMNIWNIESGELVYRIEHSSVIRSLCTTSKFIIGAVRKGIALWDISTGVKIRTLDICNKKISRVHNLKATENKLLFLCVTNQRYVQDNISTPHNVATIIDFDI